jgi:hypothetical protein
VNGDDSTHDKELPTPQMIAATAALIDEGRRSGRCGDRVTPHNLWKRKPCPGPDLTALAAAWDRRPVPTGPVPVPQEEEPEMLIIDCPGRPGLVIGVGGVKRVNPDQRNALRKIGVDADTSDALFSLRDD